MLSEQSLAAVGRAARLVHGAKSVSIFTGAGISVESGIPDFRSSGKRSPKHGVCGYILWAWRSTNLHKSKRQEASKWFHESEAPKVPCCALVCMHVHATKNLSCMSVRVCMCFCSCRCAYVRLYHCACARVLVLGCVYSQHHNFLCDIQRQLSLPASTSLHAWRMNFDRTEVN